MSLGIPSEGWIVVSQWLPHIEVGLAPALWSWMRTGSLKDLGSWVWYKAHAVGCCGMSLAHSVVQRDIWPLVLIIQRTAWLTIKAGADAP